MRDYWRPFLTLPETESGLLVFLCTIAELVCSNAFFYYNFHNCKMIDMLRLTLGWVGLVVYISVSDQFDVFPFIANFLINTTATLLSPDSQLIRYISIQRLRPPPTSILQVRHFIQSISSKGLGLALAFKLHDLRSKTLFLTPRYTNKSIVLGNPLFAGSNLSQPHFPVHHVGFKLQSSHVRYSHQPHRSLPTRSLASSRHGGRRCKKLVDEREDALDLTTIL